MLASLPSTSLQQHEPAVQVQQLRGYGAEMDSTGLCDNRGACRATMLARKNRMEKKNDDVSNVVPLFGRKVEAQPLALAA